MFWRFRTLPEGLLFPRSTAPIFGMVLVVLQFLVQYVSLVQDVLSDQHLHASSTPDALGCSSPVSKYHERLIAGSDCRGHSNISWQKLV